MKCDWEELARCALGILDQTQTGAVEAHAASCRACGEQLAQLRRLVAGLEAVPGTDNEPVDMDRLRAAIASRHAVAGRFAWVGQWIVPRPRWAAALAAAACLFLLCFHYGLAVRVGSFEVAFGGPASATPASRESAALSEEAIRRIARQEIVRDVAPTLVGLARQFSDSSMQLHGAILRLRDEIAAQRAYDQGEVHRNIKLIAEGMIDAVHGLQ